MCAAVSGVTDHQNAVSTMILPLRGLENRYTYYRVEVCADESSERRIYLLSYSLARKLWVRYVSGSIDGAKILSLLPAKDVVDSSTVSVLYSMPGEGCKPFVVSVLNALKRKHVNNQVRGFHVVTTSIYKLWLFSSHVSAELFADCFTESGVLNLYCSRDQSDTELGALGSWPDMDDQLDGAAGVPPLDVQFIKDVVRRFEFGLQGDKPYCRCVVLPLEEKFGVLKHVNAITSEGELLVTVPSGCLPFMQEESLLLYNEVEGKPLYTGPVGLFVWCNREYLDKYQLPSDIESMYQVWIDRFLRNSDNAVLHRDAFIRAFPVRLRSTEGRVGCFFKEVLQS